ncbi:MAG TPA: hypothetical protein VF132_10585 [Rudaea sp.]
MNSPTDFDTGESVGWSSQSISGGLYSGTIAVTTGTNAGANFSPLPPGQGTLTIPHWNGELYPVDTAHYHNFTIKLRDTGGTRTQPTRVVFFRDGDSAGDGSFGSSHFKYYSQVGDWAILNFDLTSEVYGTPYHAWSEYPQVHGLRVDFPTDPNAGTLGANVNVAWVRMSTPSPYTVQWTDTAAGNHFVTAVDGDGARYQFNATAVGGTSYAADLALLAPGDYQIEVKNATTSATARSGNLHINAPPQIDIAAPNVRGDPSRSYAMTFQGHQWGNPLQSVDVPQVGDFASYSFASGYFYGRPSGGDTALQFNIAAAHPIDTNLYRSVCVTFKVFGPRDVGLGSVSRFFWSHTGSPEIAGTEGFVPFNNSDLNEYCFEDIRKIPLDPKSPAVPWQNTQNTFRFDPDEFPATNGCSTPETCHDVQLNSLYLSPFAAAAPAYTLSWTLTDADAHSGTGSVKLLLNATRSNDLSTSIPIATLPYATGAQQYRFVTRHSIPNGTYYVGIQANDGLNTVFQYAKGPIVLDNSDAIFSTSFDP